MDVPFLPVHLGGRGDIICFSFPIDFISFLKVPLTSKCISIQFFFIYFLPLNWIWFAPNRASLSAFFHEGFFASGLEVKQEEVDILLDSHCRFQMKSTYLSFIYESASPSRAKLYPPPAGQTPQPGVWGKSLANSGPSVDACWVTELAVQTI